MAAGAARSHAPPRVEAPFAAAQTVESDAMRAIAVGEPAVLDEVVAFADGIQRYAVEGWFGLAPVVRGYVAAAVLERRRGELRAAAARVDEFLVAPLERLSDAQRRVLEELGLDVLSVEGAERAHPLVDVQRATQVVERRREAAEAAAVGEYLRGARGGWLVVDGSLQGVQPAPPGRTNVLGVVKSHETQFLKGRDLEVALTLPCGCRTSVFARRRGGAGSAYTWYLRLWPWDGHDVLYGLVRLERPADDAVVEEADAVSRWMLAERAPVSAPDARWDRLLYPIHAVEAYLRAQAGGWW